MPAHVKNMVIDYSIVFDQTSMPLHVFLREAVKMALNATATHEDCAVPFSDCTSKLDEDSENSKVPATKLRAK